MIFVIMCGSNHGLIDGVPRQLVNINGERVVDRTIRLLRENGVEDIVISTTDKAFESCGVPIMEYKQDNPQIWVNCFPPVDEPVCYIFGDVYFSPAAIKKIVETPTKSVEFFASSPPFAKEYIKQWAEPFAFKVQNTRYFQECIERIKQLRSEGRFYRDPIAWEVWQVVKKTAINHIDYFNYVAINDYTCDIDTKDDVPKMQSLFEPRYLIHATPKRMWYVEDYLIPSMWEQGIDNVDVWLDEYGDGCLESCMQSFLDCGRYKGATWHLQDDVIICRDFAKRTREETSGVVCGFCHKTFQTGKENQMWFSFPCIRIPNDIAADCAVWFYQPDIQARYSNWVLSKKHDDEIFVTYCDCHKVPYKNLNPCLVDHVDYLIGGSIVNADRNIPKTRASYWVDEDLVTDLKVRLASR